MYCFEKTLIRVSIEFQSYQDIFDNKYFFLKTPKTFVQVEINKVLNELGVEDRHLVARFETLWLQEADLKEEAAQNYHNQGCIQLLNCVPVS